MKWLKIVGAFIGVEVIVLLFSFIITWLKFHPSAFRDELINNFYGLTIVAFGGCIIAGFIFVIGDKE